MSYEIEASAEVRRGAVPTLLLQPLAENAIRHGVARLAAPGRVTIRAVRDGARLRIEVFNTGALATEYRAGIGLRNTMERLRFLYGGDHSFELRAEGGGVLAQVSLPWSDAGQAG
jgi:LytS/YehU family sensor histidine kinase